MKQFIFDEFGIIMHCSQIWRALDRAKWSRKVARRRALERNEELRGKWVGYCVQYTEEQLVFLDESAANERTGDRKYGWSPTGVECEVFSSIKRSKRWSFLPALDVNGWFEWLIFQGSITGNMFLAFVRNQVLPHCEPFPGKRSVLVLDNAAIHHSQELKDMCEEAGVRLEFLPPYSPDYNPIELTFKDLKTWIKRHFEDADAYASFDNFLEDAVLAMCRRDMRMHYRHCGYRVVE
jgi:transposase